MVAAINGTCVGAGLGFALACDLRIAAEGAQFATAFAAIGLTADSGLSALLVARPGRGPGHRAAAAGRAVHRRAGRMQWGLVRAVVPAEQVLDTALELARRLAAGPTAAYAEIKRALAFGAVLPLRAPCWPAEGAAQAPPRPHPVTTRAAVEASWPSERPTFEGR